MITGKALAKMSDNQLMSWLSDHRPSLQQLMASLRQLAKPIRERTIKAKTLDAYRDDFARVEKAGTVIAASGSKASFYKLRAASSRVLADRIYEALTKADRIRKTQPGTLGDLNWAAFVLDELRPLGEKLARFSKEKWEPDQVSRKERSHRQRPKLGRLPEDWRARVWERVGEGKYGSAVAVAALAGVRPEELEKGVEVQLLGDGRLAFIVSGAKVIKAGNGKAAQGQKLRAFTITVGDDPMALRLKTLAARGRVVVRVASARALTSAFCSASRKAFPKLSAPPSVYTFRHAFCANAKASGLSPEQVAQVMGHASTASQGMYGMKSQGSGGWKVEPLGDAPTPIRVAAPKGPPPSLAPAPSARREAREISAVLSAGAGARPRAPRPRI